MSISITDKELKAAAENGPAAFLEAIEAKIAEGGGKELTAENMSKLNGSQHVLNALRIMQENFEYSGYLNLIEEGYGAYLFDNPFAKALREWGAHDLSKAVYKAKKVYDENRTELEAGARDEQEFAELFDKYSPRLDKIDEETERLLDESVQTIARYVDQNLDQFIEVEK